MNGENWFKISRKLIRSYVVNRRYIFINAEKNLHASCNVLCSTPLSIISFDEICHRFIQGEKIYNELDDEPGSLYLFSTFIPMGDQFRILCRINQYSKHHNVNAKVIVSGPAKDMLSLFNYNGVAITSSEKKSLVFYLTLSSKNNEKVACIDMRSSIVGTQRYHISYGSYYYSEPSDSISRLMNIPNFGYDKIVYPVINFKIPEDKYHNSVLINPYGNDIRNNIRAVKSYSILFTNIAQKLKSLGITVYTNVIENWHKPLPGTKPLGLSIYDMVAVCRNFKHIVTTFTGFMEVMMLTDCNLSVISPTKRISRLHMAEASEHKNYWEYYLDSHSVEKLAEDIVSNIIPTECVQLNSDINLTSTLDFSKYRK